MLVKLEETGRQVHGLHIVERFGKVEYLVVLAETVLVEPAVGIVKNDGPGIAVLEIPVVGRRYRLFEGGGILEGKALRAKIGAAGKPCALLLSAHAAMAFVDKEQVLIAEASRGDGVWAFLIAQLRYLDDIDLIERTLPRQVQSLNGPESAFREFGHMLVAEPLVGRKQDGAG
ncbi:MAG: hypothetical protein A4E72_00107 [Syntrophus sp. PtaU1.Bin208]|nr:MAG: hypothetical protein A4E72_00107 [Syntrophus sp. PtaU1.Bin208]